MAERPAWETPIILEVLRDFPPEDSYRVYGRDFTIGLVDMVWSGEHRELGLEDQDMRVVDWRAFLDKDFPGLSDDSNEWYLPKDVYRKLPKHPRAFLCLDCDVFFRNLTERRKHRGHEVTILILAPAAADALWWALFLSNSVKVYKFQ